MNSGRLSRRLLLLLLLAIVCPFQALSAKAFFVSPHHEPLPVPRQQLWQQHQQALHKHRDRTLCLFKVRGGADDLAANIPRLMTPTVAATVVSALFILKGASKLIQSKTTLDKIVHQHDDDEQRLNTWIVRGIGAFSVGSAIHIYASFFPVKVALKPLQIMGLALLPRGLFFLATSLSHLVRSLGLNSRFFLINTVATIWCSLSLLLGLGNPSQTAKVYSLMSFVKACLFFFHPVKGCQILLSEKNGTVTDTSLALARDAGL